MSGQLAADGGRTPVEEKTQTDVESSGSAGSLAGAAPSLLENHRRPHREGVVEDASEGGSELPLVGQTVGPYAIVAAIGHGGMGTSPAGIRGLTRSAHAAHAGPP